MIEKLLLLFFGCFYLQNSCAQTKYNFEPIIGKSSGERRAYFSKTYPNIIEPGDSTHQKKSKEFIKQYKAFAKKVNDKDLIVDADFAEVYNRIQNNPKPTNSEIKTIDSFGLFAQKENIKWLQINCKWFSGTRCFNQYKLYEKGFLYYKELEDLLDNVTIQDFPDKQWMLYNMSDNYMWFQDYSNSIRVAKKGIACVTNAQVTSFRLYNNIGICFQKQKQNDSAIYYYNQGIRYIHQYLPTEKVWENIIKGNIGECMIEQGKYQDALPYANIDIDNAEQIHDLPLAANAYMNKANILMHQNNAAEAKPLLQKSYDYIHQSKSFKRLEKLYPLLSTCAKMQGNGNLAANYLDSAIVFKDSNNKEFNAIQILRSEQTIALRKQNEFSLEKKQNRRERNLLIGFALALALIGLYIYKSQVKKHKQAQLLKEMELAKMEAELKSATLELNVFAQKIAENINKINELEKINGLDEKSELLSNLQQATILTDEEWDNFKNLFDKVHKGYLMRLKERFPNLSPAETRFMVLAKLGLNTKEMGNTLGISAQSVRVAWHRLRKKLNLDDHSDLSELVDAI